MVHLAAIPAPGLRPNAATFANNIVATYNVFAAARAAGIRNIVWASSETVLGLPFDDAAAVRAGRRGVPAPAGTARTRWQAPRGADGRQFCRWDPELKMIGLRFSNVMEPERLRGFPCFDADAPPRKWNLWGYIDARDGAQAVRLALEHDGPGRTCSSSPTRTP